MWYDVLVVCILLFFVFRGASKGMIWQLAHIAGILLCFTFAGQISAFADPYVHIDPPLDTWVILVGAYLVFTFICFTIARSLNSWVEKNKMKEFDRHLGALFGLVKGVILAIILTFAVVTVSENARVALRDSYSGRYAAIIMDRLHPLLPSKLHDKVQDYIHLLDSPDLPLLHNDHDHEVAGTGSDASLGEPTPFSSTTVPSASSGFLGQVRSLLGDEVQRLVSEALSRTSDPAAQSRVQQNLTSILNAAPAGERSQLQQQILQQGATHLDQYLAWRAQQIAPSGSSNSSSQTNGTSTPASQPSATQRRTQLIRDIAGKYTTIPSVRPGIEQQISQDLAGLPETVALAVLEDWRADVFAQPPDPDPQTGSGSPLEQRMLRQLQRAGVSLNQLPFALQQRLGGGQAQSPREGNPL